MMTQKRANLSEELKRLVLNFHDEMFDLEENISIRKKNRREKQEEKEVVSSVRLIPINFDEYLIEKRKKK